MKRNYPQNQEIEYSELDWEIFWNENETSIKLELEKEMRAYYTAGGEYEEERLQNEVEDMLAAEKEFVKSLLPKLQFLLNSNSKVLMLVDIDETVAGPYDTGDGIDRSMVRPIFLKLLDKLQSYRSADKLEVGIISSRSEIKQQLNDSNQLLRLKDYMSPDKIYTTIDNRIHGLTHEENKEQIRKFASDDQSVLRDNLIEDDYNKLTGTDRDKSSLEKIATLQEIRAKVPEGVPILVVDDENYPNFLDENKKLYGVKVEDQAIFAVF